MAILNESKYGYATEGNVMRLSLLRAPTLPDADADQGEHAFAFAIYPHAGTFEESDVAEVAEAFNAPLRGESCRCSPGVLGFTDMNGPRQSAGGPCLTTTTSTSP